jgi:hypothetical protein
MKPTAGTAFVAMRGEEGIERLSGEAPCHANTIVSKNDLDVII